MPELHKLTPTLGLLQDRGQRVALLTDGRMSGASGKVLAAIHLVPEAVAGGAIAKLRDGDVITIDAEASTVEVDVPEAEWAARTLAPMDLAGNQFGVGRELFAVFRECVDSAEDGACALFGSTGL
jgi:phosphogluconate dehydratase